jgi:hypothetical protein
MKRDSVNIGLAGEYYVLAQLAERGLVGSLTLSNTKGVDILVTNQRLNTLFKVEVKTTRKPPYRERLFGPEPFYGWPMSQKHESVRDPRLYYCFVLLRGADQLPRFFIVESDYVANYVRRQHQQWITARKGQVKDTPIRRFRIPVSDPDKFESRWSVFSDSERSV